MHSKSKTILASHRDAATRVSTYLSEAHGITLKPIVALEVIARALGAANWQVLSAMAEQGRTPRMGDVAVWGDVRDLPPIGKGNIFQVFQQTDADLTRIVRHPVATAGAPTPSSADSAPAGDTADQARAPAQDGLLGDIWQNLVSRGVDQKRLLAQDIEAATEDAQATRGLASSHLRGVGLRQLPAHNIEAALEGAQAAMGLVYAPPQLEAVRTALEAPVTFIQGDAGTGKTKVVAGIVRAARLAGLANVLDAIRSYRCLVKLHLNPHAKGNDLENCELVVMDERVFRNTSLFRTVLKNASPACRIVIVFDAVPSPVAHAAMPALVADLVRLGHVCQVQLVSRMRQSPILAVPAEIILDTQER